MIDLIIGDKHFRLYSTKEVAELLHVEARTVLRYYHDHRLPAVKVKGCYHFAESELIAFLTGSSTRSVAGTYGRSTKELKRKRLPKESTPSQWENEEELW